MKNLKIIFLIFYIFNLVTTSVFSNENLKNRIYKNLRCLVCQGQSIADSNSEFALTVKSVVNDKLEEGLSEEDV